jgi:hypothetical protein
VQYDDKYKDDQGCKFTPTDNADIADVIARIRGFHIRRLRQPAANPYKAREDCTLVDLLSNPPEDVDQFVVRYCLLSIPSSSDKPLSSCIYNPPFSGAVR